MRYNEYFTKEEEEYTLSSLEKWSEKTTYPAIFTAQVEYDVDYGVNTSFNVLGIIASFDEAKTTLKTFIDSVMNDESFDEVVGFSPAIASLHGITCVGGAFYRE